jgi:putative ATPase
VRTQVHSEKDSNLRGGDVGNADPQAIILANAAFQIAEFVGMPEARIPLAQAAVYVACAPKSNSAYLGIDNAIKAVEEERTKEVPDHLKGSSYGGAAKLGRGIGYQYAHDFKNHYVKQQYMPGNGKYYIPGNLGYEAKIKAWLEKLDREAEDQNNKG